MWGAAGVALVAITVAVMSFISRGKALKTVGEMGAEIESLEGDIAALMEEIAALALGDHGLDHDDMRDVLFPDHIRDDSVDDS